MGFIDHYLEKHRLDKMPDKHKKNVDQLEKELKEKAKSNNGTTDFEEDILKAYGPQIADLVERASKALHRESGFRRLYAVFNIGIEVYQLVDQMAEKVVPPGITGEKAKQYRVEFGKDLTYFIWKTIDPLSGYVNWLPFKQSIERFVVRWLAGYALDAALDLLLAKNTLVPMNSTIKLRALP